MVTPDYFNRVIDVMLEVIHEFEVHKMSFEEYQFYMNELHRLLRDE